MAQMQASTGEVVPPFSRGSIVKGCVLEIRPRESAVDIRL